MILTNGSIPLFRIFGISVAMHWSWLLVAFYEIGQRNDLYSSLIWSIAEYLSLFVIVLLHEFGHAFACRQVGGSANRILLWPLGGIAYVSPPRRPGAMLWSIAAGPLVNVLLLPVFWILLPTIDPSLHPDLYIYVKTVAYINIVILIFNILPIYPLDGGQILRSILWFVVGEGRSLWIASIIGLIGAVGIIGLAVYLDSIWITILAVFAGMQAWGGLRESRDLLRNER